jgi:exodeoxyribonuclease VII small subunit
MEPVGTKPGAAVARTAATRPVGPSISGEAAPRSFEHSLTELEQIVRQLEEGQLGLADSLARYEQGVKRLKECYELLERAERRIELLERVGADGEPVTRPFDAEATIDRHALAEGDGKPPKPPPRRSVKPTQPPRPSEAEGARDLF